MRIFSSGILKVTKFQWLKSNQKALLHFLENNDFEMKIVNLNQSEIHYPINIHDFDPKDIEVVYEDNEHVEEDNLCVFLSS